MWRHRRDDQNIVEVKIICWPNKKWPNSYAAIRRQQGFTYMYCYPHWPNASSFVKRHALAQLILQQKTATVKAARCVRTRLLTLRWHALYHISAAINLVTVLNRRTDKTNNSLDIWFQKPYRTDWIKFSIERYETCKIVRRGTYDLARAYGMS